VSFSGPLAQWGPLRKWGFGVGLAAALLLGSAAGARPAAVESQVVALAQLPAEAREVRRLIGAGGPFEFAKDGAVFGNRERLLPPRPRGYYREYTVTRSDARHRGAQRMVCGGREPKTPDACYYSADHYNSFRRISP
jgi:ribonuclease T1